MDLDLFLASISARFDADLREELNAQVEELADAERVAITLNSRIRSAFGGPLNVILRGGQRVRGIVVETGKDWVLIREGVYHCLVHTPAIVAAYPLGAADARSGPTADGPGIGYLLRELAQEKIAVAIGHDAGEQSGIVGGVYADHFDVDTSGTRAIDTRDQWSAPVISLQINGIRWIRMNDFQRA
ncbi:MAG: hypothetical protein Q4C87_05015 [Actinomycetaceae bacterium]|nr:hypothetical protein [Actinomycetaceae bacterium]